MLVEIAYSGACGTQVMEWRGDKGEDKWVPHCLGHEGTGTVLETGSAVTKVKAGDKVVLSWIKGSGIEAGGAVYEWDGKKVNAGGVTTFQRHAVVSENRLTLLPGRSADGRRGPARLRRADRHGRRLQRAEGRSRATPSRCSAPAASASTRCMAAAFAGAMPVIGIDPESDPPRAGQAATARPT